MGIFDKLVKVISAPYLTDTKSPVHGSLAGALTRLDNDGRMCKSFSVAPAVSD